MSLENFHTTFKTVVTITRTYHCITDINPLEGFTQIQYRHIYRNFASLFPGRAGETTYLFVHLGVQLCGAIWRYFLLAQIRLLVPRERYG
jgi:hypothetical protein